MKIYDLLEILDTILLKPPHALYGDQMGTTWGQHDYNVKTTWGPHGCGDYVGTTWMTIWDTTHGDHRNVETTWEHCRDNMGTT